MLTTRQENILSKLVSEYVRSAEPVSSGYLALHTDSFDCSPATIRNELMELDEKGFVLQPHPSSGRIPTNKGYRYFVDRLMDVFELDNSALAHIHGVIRKSKNKNHELPDIVSSLIEMSSQLTHSFSFAEVIDTDQFFASGLLELAQQPEFESRENVIGLARVVDRLRAKIDDLDKNIAEYEACKVFIGSELPLLEKNLSIVTISLRANEHAPVIMGLIGPTRMDYSYQIAFMNEINKSLKEFFYE